MGKCSKELWGEIPVNIFSGLIGWLVQIFFDGRAESIVGCPRPMCKCLKLTAGLAVYWDVHGSDRFTIVIVSWLDFTYLRDENNLLIYIEG